MGLLVPRPVRVCVCMRAEKKLRIVVYMCRYRED